MAGKIRIDPERCKGCGLCVGVCPAQLIRIAQVSNRNGYFPAEADPAGCTGCARCATMCPDAAITVFRRTAIPDSRSPGKPVEAVKEGS